MTDEEMLLVNESYMRMICCVRFLNAFDQGVYDKEKGTFDHPNGIHMSMRKFDRIIKDLQAFYDAEVRYQKSMGIDARTGEIIERGDESE